MTKEDFEKGMNLSCLLVTEQSNKHSCNAIEKAFMLLGMISSAAIVRKHYSSTIVQLIEHVTYNIDWKKLNIYDSEKKKQFRIKLLTDFKTKCNQHKLYKHW